MNAPAIVLDGIAKGYGSVVAVDNVSLTVREGARHAVIGPNGAGKSTLFAMVAGTIRPTSGTIRLFGENVTRLPDHQRARRGLAKTFQHSSVFPSMTLLDNVVLAAERRHGHPARPFGPPDAVAVEVALKSLAQAGLEQRTGVLAAELSHGERRQLEVALALALDPRVVLFDEPTAGMSPAETSRFVDIVRSMSREITVLIIEHDLDVVFSLSDTVSVLHLGAVIANGTPEEVRESELVQQTYLGTGPDLDIGRGDALEGEVR
jgi:branched-chain amino acid transport system ATP-binding protein